MFLMGFTGAPPAVKKKNSLLDILPDADLMSQVSLDRTKEIVSGQIKKFLEVIALETKKAALKGESVARISTHHHGYHPDTIIAARKILEEKNYTVWDDNHHYNCTCRVHLAWTFEKKTASPPPQKTVSRLPWE